MGDLLESLVWGAKREQYCVIGGGSLQKLSFIRDSKKLSFKLNSPCEVTSIYRDIDDATTTDNNPNLSCIICSYFCDNL
jgi:hypothetical protein